MLLRYVNLCTVSLFTATLANDTLRYVMANSNVA